MTTRPEPYGPPYDAKTEHARIIEALEQELARSTASSVELRLCITQERLNVLAEHPKTRLDYNTHPPMVKTVTVELVAGDRRATGIVAALGPLVGRREPFTQETLPAQPGGRERISEGVSSTAQTPPTSEASDV